MMMMIMMMIIKNRSQMDTNPVSIREDMGSNVGDFPQTRQANANYVNDCFLPRLFQFIIH
jgi:hypothetical protein